MAVVCHVCLGPLEWIEYCMVCNPDGLDITEETRLGDVVIAAAVAFVDRETYNISPHGPAFLDLQAAVSAYLAAREGRGG